MNSAPNTSVVGTTFKIHKIGIVKPYIEYILGCANNTARTKNC